MAVASLGTYDFQPADPVEKFPAPLLYVGWEDHKMFCAPHCVPMPPTTVFGDFVKNVLPDMYSAHPDFARIAWDQVEWFSSGQPFTPDMARTMAENGIGHKSVIRFRTPGLTGLGGSGF